MLEIEELRVQYGGIHALRGIDLTVPEGRIVTLIGANGAGKTTLTKAITGLVSGVTGRIRFKGKEISELPSHQRVGLGLALVPEGRKIFPNLSVLDNLRIGALLRKDERETGEDLEVLLTMFPRLKERSRQRGGTLSGGEQQMLAFARALMSNPELLLMDEPSLGLAPFLVGEIFSHIKEIHKKGKTILLIEQNALAALKVADYGYVLENGRLTLEGSGEDLLKDERIRKAYLGED
jgi:branched-chain amino acid transport system ATP-binding protein